LAEEKTYKQTKFTLICAEVAQPGTCTLRRVFAGKCASLEHISRKLVPQGIPGSNPGLSVQKPF